MNRRSFAVRYPDGIAQDLNVPHLKDFVDIKRR